MVRKIVFLLFLTTMVYSQTYTITEEELLILETTIATQQRLLTEQGVELNALKQELVTSKQSLIKAQQSFGEYEQGALVIQSRLRDALLAEQKKLKGWQIAVPVAAAVMLVGGFLIGHFAQ